MSRDGKNLICGLDDGTIDVRDIKSGLSVNKFKGHSGQVTFVNTVQYKSWQLTDLITNWSIKLDIKSVIYLISFII